MAITPRAQAEAGADLPRQAAPAQSLPPHAPAGGGGRTPYPTYDVMAPDKWRHDWDDKTRRLVLDRVGNVPGRSFLNEAEFTTLTAICDRLLPQDHRAAELRIPIAPFIDQRLARGEGNGYRDARMPWDDEAYRRGLAGIDETSRMVFGGQCFTELAPPQQEQVLAALEDGDPPGATWRQAPAVLFFKLLMHDVVDTYYAHPTAWSEIGFGGPASPRGHVRLSLGKRDPWEAAETAPMPRGERGAIDEAGEHEPNRS